MRRRIDRSAPLALLGMLGAAGAVADVTIEQAFKVDAVGAMSALVSEGTVTTAVAGRRSRSDNQVRAASELMLLQARNPNGSTIVHLDEQRVVSLRPDQQQFREMSFGELRAQFDYGARAFEDAQASGELMNLPVDEADCYWYLSDTSVAHTREKALIAGIEAERHVINTRQSCLVEETGQECDIRWRLERWNTMAMPGAEEVQAFRAELVHAMGGEDILSAASINAGGLLTMFQSGWNQALAHAEQLPGYPVKTIMTLEMGGEFCTTPAGKSIEEDSDWNVMQEIAKDTAKNSAINTASNTVATTVARTVGGLGGWIAGTAAEMGTRKGLEKMSEEKEEEPSPEEEEAVQGADPEGEGVLLFALATEVTAVSVNEIPEARFETPQGWTKASK